MVQRHCGPARPMSGVARHAWLLSSVAIGCLIAAPALAQKAPDAKETSVEEVVVTGTSIRGEQPVGSDLIAIGRDEILSTGAPTTQELGRPSTSGPATRCSGPSSGDVPVLGVTPLS